MYYKLVSKLPLIFYYLLKGIIALGLFLAILRQEWQSSFFIAWILLLTFAPKILSRRYKIYLPLVFEIFVVFFVFLSLFLGSFHGYYEKYWWWDLFLHGKSSILSGILGFMLIYVLNGQKKVHLRMNPFFVALFAFTFAMTIGTIWEIFEFCMDTFWGLNMQRNSLTDTMNDIILNTTGAFIVSLVGYLWMTRKTFSLFFDTTIKQFTKKNKHFLE